MFVGIKGFNHMFVSKGNSQKCEKFVSGRYYTSTKMTYIDFAYYIKKYVY